MSDGLLNFSSRSAVPMVWQSEMAECGLAALVMVANYFGKAVDLPYVRQQISQRQRGVNLSQLMDIAQNIGLQSRALECPLTEVSELSLPCILHWNMNHFVVLTRVEKKRGEVQYHINDPALGSQIVNASDFSKQFTGICLELSPIREFKLPVKKHTLKVFQLWSEVKGGYSSLAILLAISLLIQIFTVANPYYVQWVVDYVLLNQDTDLLMVLAIGFSLIMLFKTIGNALREFILIRLTSTLNFQLGVNLMRHLLTLPITYFQSRHLGDISSKFSSLQDIRERLSTGLLETLLDGFMSIVLLTVMTFYSWQLTLVVVGMTLLYGLVRMIFYRRFHSVNLEAILVSAKEQTNFLESIRAVQTIKLFGQERERHHQWQNLYAEAINSEIKLSRLKLYFNASDIFIFGLEHIIVIYIAAHQVIDGNFSVGMLMAYIAYKIQFSERAKNLIEQLILFRLLKLHLERVSDIVLHDAECFLEGPDRNINTLPAQLMLKNVSFGFDQNNDLLKNIDLQVPEGKIVAIVGASGQGKSTLIRLILGLYQPNSGAIMFGGIPINKLGLRNYRRQIATVMQDDHLLSGSILENIAFGDDSPNMTLVECCAKQAAVFQDITNMTMGFQTAIGDLGEGLSGGQIQRVLLARALYRQPKLLVLDEASSHLDVMTERMINDALKALSLTRIIVAHRQETIALADKVYELKSGFLTELR
jgi:ATP-binding cassette subfamily B protein RaxB